MSAIDRASVLRWMRMNADDHRDPQTFEGYRGAGPFEALGTAVRVSGRRVVKTYGVPAGTPATGE